MRLLIIFSFLFVLISKSYTNKFQCDRRRFPLVTDLRPSDCDTANGYHYIEDAVHGCFPACLHIETHKVWPNRMCHGEAANGRNGNYEPLQCDIGSQQCWCAEPRAEPRTGAPISPIVPLGTMSRLPCYDRRTVGAQYLRRCESELYAQRRIAEEFRMHGTTTVNFPLHFCQYDGSFGPIRVERGIVFCVWRDGSHLGYQQAADSSLVNVTC
ncbi:Thyroglobulin type-1 repeat, partial [Popillia japonica]